jgi:predicted alpha/beta superfamily hydrolase
MRINRAMSGAIVFLITGILFIGFQLADKSKNEGIVSCSIDAARFHDKAAVSSIYKQKSRLITIEGFHASKLDNNRDLYVYLPPGYYNNPIKKYPVLYVQDGKGVFYMSDWSKESLNMHLKADELISSGRIEKLIIVGISNIGEQRSSEYTHWDGIDGVFVDGKGELYEDFVINDVKPFIEANFRAKTGREHNAIMGASLGGLVSFNIGMRNPDVFSKIAVQSPFFGWGEERLLDGIRTGEYKDKRNIKLWMDMGTAESEFMTVMRKVAKELLAQGYKPGVELAVSEIPGGRHSEGSWAERVDDILIYFYGLDK